MWLGVCMVVSMLYGSGKVWWHVLWCWWLPVGCGKYVGISGVGAVFWVCCFEECLCVFSVGFVVACLWWGCVEWSGGSNICVWVGVWCGPVILAWVLLLCWM